MVFSNNEESVDLCITVYGSYILAGASTVDKYCSDILTLSEEFRIFSVGERLIHCSLYRV